MISTQPESKTKVLILRIWTETPGDEGAAVWRCVVEDPFSKARRGFASLDALVAFLTTFSGVSANDNTDFRRK